MSAGRKRHRASMATSLVGMRFAPDKSVAGYATASRGGYDWWVEPALAGYSRLEHAGKSDDKAIPVPVCATPAILPGVGVIVGAYDGTVRLFDPLFEKTFWTRRLFAPIYAPLLWLPEGDRVIVADTRGTVVCFSLKGAEIWTLMLDKPVYPAMEVLRGTGRIFVCCFDGELTVIDADKGDIVAQAQLPRPWFAERAPRAGHRDPYASPIQIGPDRVLVSAANTLTAFDCAGEVVWRHVGKAQYRASPTACSTHSTVLATSVDGMCSLLDGESGKPLCVFALGDKVVASAATSGGVAAIGTASGQVHGIDMSTGQEKWSHLHGAPFDHTGFSLLPDGGFICTNAKGNVVARDGADGRFLWETSQLIGLTDHPPRIDTTPICTPNGIMYAGSYEGALYAFIFQERLP